MINKKANIADVNLSLENKADKILFEGLSNRPAKPANSYSILEFKDIIH